ncbi:MAG: GAF domain-containing sensor histidine kinase [Gemmatimonadota bacterium]|jgi:signal transduction histidine kinase
MDLSVPQAALSEIAASYLQVAITLGLALLCLVLHRRFRKPYFALWSVAWMVYATRLGAILSFMHTGHPAWLYWHQVTTGWAAVAILWAALVFSRGPMWRRWYGLVVLFPPVWSFIAIYRLDNFLLAAGPAVLFLAAATAWTAWAFFRYHREVGSPAARLLALTFAVWALHDLDYPFLRARGMWNPWGYYLDIGFELAVGTGILFLVLEDLDQGLKTLTALSGELRQRGRPEVGIPEAVLRRALGLRGVHGSALYLSSGEGGAFVHGAGVCTLWPHEDPPESAWRSVAAVRASGVPEVIQGFANRDERAPWAHPYTAALPILRGETVAGALVVVGEARDPFTALDTHFLLAFGQQVGAALENQELYHRLEDRTAELERLQIRMVRQHEEERNRLSRELHDETAQVLAALNMQLGVLKEKGDEDLAPALDRARGLVGEGIRSIRSVTRNLRPTALDDLGLLSALRALARDFQGQEALEVTFQAPTRLPPLEGAAELALFRALQEALANSVRHGHCSRVEVTLGQRDGQVALEVVDDGVGFPTDDPRDLNRTRGGLAGIRERIAGVGGEFTLENTSGGGARVQVRVPADRKSQEEGVEG